MPPVANKTELENTGGAVCSHCGAPLHGAANVCWLCFTPIAALISKRPAAIPRAELRVPRAVPANALGGGFSLASLMMFVTLASIVLGTITIAPGLGVPLAFVAFFTWLRTMGVVRKRATKGSAVTAGEKILLFVRSFLSTIALLTLLGAVAVAALSAAVYTSCALESSASPDNYGTFAVVAAIITAVVIYATIKLIQYRRRWWRRDIGESE